MPEILLDGLDQLPRRFQFGQDFLGKPAAELLLQRIENLHPLQRIHAGLDDRRVERHAVGPLLGHAADFFDHQLRQTIVRAAGGGRSFRCFERGGQRRTHDGLRRTVVGRLFAVRAGKARDAASAARHCPTTSSVPAK